MANAHGTPDARFRFYQSSPPPARERDVEDVGGPDIGQPMTKTPARSENGGNGVDGAVGGGQQHDGAGNAADWNDRGHASTPSSLRVEQRVQGSVYEAQEVDRINDNGSQGQGDEGHEGEHGEHTSDKGEGTEGDEVEEVEVEVPDMDVATDDQDEETWALLDAYVRRDSPVRHAVEAAQLTSGAASAGETIETDRKASRTPKASVRVVKAGKGGQARPQWKRVPNKERAKGGANSRFVTGRSASPARAAKRANARSTPVRTAQSRPLRSGGQQRPAAGRSRGAGGATKEAPEQETLAELSRSVHETLSNVLSLKQQLARQGQRALQPSPALVRRTVSPQQVPARRMGPSAAAGSPSMTQQHGGVGAGAPVQERAAHCASRLQSLRKELRDVAREAVSLQRETRAERSAQGAATSRYSMTERERIRARHRSLLKHQERDLERLARTCGRPSSQGDTQDGYHYGHLTSSTLAPLTEVLLSESRLRTTQEGTEAIAAIPDRAFASTRESIEALRLATEQSEIDAWRERSSLMQPMRGVKDGKWPTEKEMAARRARIEDEVRSARQKAEQEVLAAEKEQVAAEKREVVSMKKEAERKATKEKEERLEAMSRHVEGQLLVLNRLQEHMEDQLKSQKEQREEDAERAAHVAQAAQTAHVQSGQAALAPAQVAVTQPIQAPIAFPVPQFTAPILRHVSPPGVVPGVPVFVPAQGAVSPGMVQVGYPSAVGMTHAQVPYPVPSVMPQPAYVPGPAPPMYMPGAPGVPQMRQANPVNMSYTGASSYPSVHRPAPQPTVVPTTGPRVPYAPVLQASLATSRVNDNSSIHTSSARDFRAEWLNPIVSGVAMNMEMQRIDIEESNRQMQYSTPEERALLDTVSLASAGCSFGQHILKNEDAAKRAAESEAALAAAATPSASKANEPTKASEPTSAVQEQSAPIAQQCDGIVAADVDGPELDGQVSQFVDAGCSARDLATIAWNDLMETNLATLSGVRAVDNKDKGQDADGGQDADTHEDGPGDVKKEQHAALDSVDDSANPLENDQSTTGSEELDEASWMKQLYRMGEEALLAADQATSAANSQRVDGPHGHGGSLPVGRYHDVNDMKPPATVLRDEPVMQDKSAADVSIIDCLGSRGLEAVVRADKMLEHYKQSHEGARLETEGSRIPATVYDDLLPRSVEDIIQDAVQRSAMMKGGVLPYQSGIPRASGEKTVLYHLQSRHAMSAIHPSCAKGSQSGETKPLSRDLGCLSLVTERLHDVGVPPVSMPSAVEVVGTLANHFRSRS